MREIIFRGKRKDTGEWIYGDLIHYDKDTYIILPQYQRDWDIQEAGIPIATETIGQYTGIKDKNGKEIYEGDIVKSISYRGKILIDKIIYNEEDVAFTLGCGLLFARLNNVIIGNIYDNQELKDFKDERTNEDTKF